MPYNCWVTPSQSLQNASPKLSTSFPLGWVDEKPRLELEEDLEVRHSCEINRCCGIWGGCFWFWGFFFLLLLKCVHSSFAHINPPLKAAASRGALTQGASSSRFSASEPQPDSVLATDSSFPEIQTHELFCFLSGFEAVGHSAREKSSTPVTGGRLGAPAASLHH